jgi:Ca-activated chloride channel homolog
METIMKSLLLILLTSLAVSAAASEASLKEGNRLFRNGRYEEALKKYNEALVDAPHSNILRFNAGDATYQMGDFSSAERQFKETADQAPEPILRGAAHYNRGNALFRQQKWQEAVDAYKESLRVNPADEDAKYNLGVALNVLKNPSQAPQQPKPHKQDEKKQDDKDKKSGQEQKKPGSMSPEDAERLLSAAGAGEKKKTNAKAAKPGARQPDEDW